jgi:hypothetical protein
MSRPGQPRIIGRSLFMDGLTRDMYENADRRQWVVGRAGERVYGVWLPPADEPVVVASVHEQGHSPGEPRAHRLGPRTSSATGR